ILFAREGASLVLADINESAGREGEREITSTGGTAIFEGADITLDADCRRIAELAVRQFGALHILVNCACIVRRASVTDITEDDWDRVMAVNVKSIFLTSRHAIPHLAKSGGVIINIASGWGLAGGPRAAAYCASKGAVVLLTKAMAIDHGPQK